MHAPAMIHYTELPIKLSDTTQLSSIRHEWRAHSIPAFIWRAFSFLHNCRETRTQQAGVQVEILGVSTSDGHGQEEVIKPSWQASFHLSFWNLTHESL